MRISLILTSGIALAVLLIAACNEESPTPSTDQPLGTAGATPSEPQIAATSATPTPIPTIEPPPADTPTPVPTPTPSPPTPAEVFAGVSPAVAYVETGGSSGSALLVDGGYLVTNSHVVWPSTAVKVTFPDGTVVQNTPVVGWDLMADVAVLGPVRVSAEPIALSDTPVPAVGSEVLTVGYPGSPGDPPQPTLGRGLISRYREWPQAGLIYIQSSAPIEEGQSGGALISETGEIVGLTTYSIGETNQSLALASADIAPRIQSIVSGNDPSGIGSRLLSLSGGDIRYSGTLGTFWDTSAYVIQESVGTQVNITLESQDDLTFTVYDSLGDAVLEVDDYSSGAETGTLTVEYAEPYFVVVNQWDEGASTFTISATHTLTPIPDPDDGRALRVGQVIQGSLDYPGDVDTYTIHLSSAQRVQMATTSFALDTFLAADFFGAIDNEIIIDDDSGGGLFGFDSQIVYRAPHTGEFIVVVSENYYETGGYTLAISQAVTSTPQTVTTRADLFDDVEDTDGFGLHELKETFSSLPPAFEVTEQDEQLSPDLDTAEVGYASYDPIQILYVSSEGPSEGAALGVELLAASPDLLLSSMSTLGGVQEDAISNFESLQVALVGQSAVGYRFDVDESGLTWAATMVIFARGDYIAAIMSMSPVGAFTLITAQDAAQLLDEALIEYLADQ